MEPEGDAGFQSGEQAMVFMPRGASSPRKARLPK